MATKRAADSTLYHVSPKGFWKKLQKIAVVNPDISTGLPIVEHNRYPQPASRLERYSTPATKASDPAQNPYWKRDVRRAYPQLSVITQSDLSSLLIQHSQAAAVAEPGSTAVAPESQEPVELTAAIAKVTSEKKVYSVENNLLPPKLPSAYKPWKAQLQPPPPHDPHGHWAMDLWK